MKKYTIVLALIIFASGIRAEHKVRISLAGGYAFENTLAGRGTFSISPKVTIAYPISPKEKDFNAELGLLGIYETQITGSDLRVPGFGFGIRIFYNNWTFVRPYFNHEVLTRLIYINGRNNSARTFSVLLGLGADFPLDADRIKESHSVFIDLSYVFYNSVYFDTAEDSVKTVFFTAGYSLPF
jgi:hypothetical protein